jgi:hypothetical protein
VISSRRSQRGCYPTWSNHWMRAKSKEMWNSVNALNVMWCDLTCYQCWWMWIRCISFWCWLCALFSSFCRTTTTPINCSQISCSARKKWGSDKFCDLTMTSYQPTNWQDFRVYIPSKSFFIPLYHPPGSWTNWRDIRGIYNDGHIW